MRERRDTYTWYVPILSRLHLFPSQNFISIFILNVLVFMDFEKFKLYRIWAVNEIFHLEA